MKKLLGVLFFMILLAFPAGHVLAAGSDFVGQAKTTDRAVLIDLEPITAYELNGEIYIRVLDLNGYGFDVVTLENGGKIQVTRNLTATGGHLPLEKINIPLSSVTPGRVLFSVYDTDTIVTLDGKKVDCYASNQAILLNVKSLEQAARVTEQENRIYVDVRKNQLETKWQAAEKQVFPTETVVEKNTDTQKKVTESKSYAGEAKDGMREGIGRETMDQSMEGSSQVAHTVCYGQYQNDKKNGISFESRVMQEPEQEEVPEAVAFAQYRDGVYHGYCLFETNGQDAERFQGYFENGQKNGWGREAVPNEDYFYGFEVVREGEYKNDIFVDYKIDSSVSAKELQSVLVSEGGDVLITQDDIVFVKGLSVDGQWRAAPYRIMEKCRQYLLSSSGEAPCYLTPFGDMYVFSQEKQEFVLSEKDVKTMNADYFIKTDGKLYSMKDHEKITDHAMESSGNLILKVDGTVQAIVYSTNSRNVTSVRFLQAMEGCKAISSLEQGYGFAIKNDNTLWGWKQNGPVLDEAVCLMDEQVKKVMGGASCAVLTGDGKLLYYEDSGAFLQNPSIEPVELMDGVKDFSVGKAAEEYGGLEFLVVKRDGTLWQINSDFTPVQITEFHMKGNAFEISGSKKRGAK